MNEQTSGREAPAEEASWINRVRQWLAPPLQNQERLIGLLRQAVDEAVLDADAESMIEGVLQVTEMQARDIMIPRSQMVVIGRDQSFAEILPVVVESGFSRFPVVGESRDEVLGLLLAKDLLRSAGVRETEFELRELLRPAVFVPESKRLNVLLKDFRSSRNHMAIVVDEYSGIAGLVTIEDVLEQIVGEIDDEHDYEEDNDIVSYGNQRFRVRALTPIEDFNAQFGTRFSDEEFDTVGGLILNAFGRLPRRGEHVSLGPCDFTVMRADKRRLHWLEVNLAEPVATDSQ